MGDQKFSNQRQFSLFFIKNQFFKFILTKIQ